MEVRGHTVVLGGEGSRVHWGLEERSVRYLKIKFKGNSGHNRSRISTGRERGQRAWIICDGHMS